jgi:hypothetical protein
LIRTNGLVLALSLVLAIAATAFGVRAVPAEHHAESGAGHEEHRTHIADHEDDEGANGVLDPREVLAALSLSILAIALVLIRIRTSRSTEPIGIVRLGVAVASAGAAAIHFAVVDQHFAEYWLFGAFFVAVALAQLGWAVAVASNPTRTVYVIGALGNALIAVTWVISRTTGLPLGPGAGEPEPAGIADVVSTAFELVVVAGTLLLLRGRELRRSWPVTFLRPAVMIAAIALTTLALAGLAGL